MKVKIIGYWNHNHMEECDVGFNQYQKYPRPQDLIDSHFWAAYNREAIIQYLANGIPCNFYRGFSSCRICDKSLGTHERTDGVWCWPDKLEHYVSHDVILPKQFLDSIIAGNFVVPAKESLTNEQWLYVDTNLDFWAQWAADNGVKARVSTVKPKNTFDLCTERMAQELFDLTNKDILDTMSRDADMRHI